MQHDRAKKVTRGVWEYRDITFYLMPRQGGGWFYQAEVNGKTLRSTDLPKSEGKPQQRIISLIDQALSI
ncbi:MAG: hypothetical protein MJA83_10280 [Gammaproteobacteria bacterium]|nr:hypothetical protein [Gammaproteobacteria bacterium]